MNKQLPHFGLAFRIHFLGLLFVSDAWAGATESLIAVIPQPVQLKSEQGDFFRITPATTVVAPAPTRNEAEQLIDALSPAMGFRLKLTETGSATGGVIVFGLDVSSKEQLGEEGYTLNVAPQRIDIRAAGPAGLFYGVQTLRQLLPAQVFSAKRIEDVEWIVPGVTVTDYPRFAWRGLLIDPARHFIPLADVKRFIDAMGLHKFNRLQIHLTDNEGWRIEIKKYPKLAEIGSRMDWSLRHNNGAGPRRFGFYTQDEIRQLVRYAAQRHITIVPEIEMPYHAGAAIVCYPRTLGLAPERYADLPFEQRWGKSGGLLAPRREAVVFMQDVLAEVIELFPSRFIHIGGDEANAQLWANDPEMQSQMQRLGCDDAHELHSWFIKQMDAFLATRGRRLVGWDEILQGGVAPGATVMSWRGEAGGLAAAKAGHDVVMTPTSHTYFDYYQGPRDKEPAAIGGLVTVARVYSFEPIPLTLDAARAKHVLGGQGQLWGEYISSRAHREYMTYPRGCALIETLWSPRDQHDYERFITRLEKHVERLGAADVNYHRLE